jgi:phosphopantothenoylcysteine decarboxylase/phosphopantothenate--cysteine ligase
MLAVVKTEMPSMDVFIAAAAVSDFSFKTNSQKIKKTNLNQTLEIIPSPDILDYVIKNKNRKTKIVGFAAETNLTEEMLQEKYSRKPVDILIGTQVDNGLINAHTIQGFQLSEAKYLIFDGDFVHKQELSKNHLAKFAFDHLTGKA